MRKKQYVFASLILGLFLTFALAPSHVRAEEDESTEQPSDGMKLTLKGEAKPIPSRTSMRTEVVRFRGARQNPDFMEENWQEVQNRDAQFFKNHREPPPPLPLPEKSLPPVRFQAKKATSGTKNRQAASQKPSKSFVKKQRGPASAPAQVAQSIQAATPVREAPAQVATNQSDPNSPQALLKAMPEF